jgi:hypothetical protein
MEKLLWWESFRDEVTADQAIAIGKWLIEYYEQEKRQTLELLLPCYDCGEETMISDCLLEDWHGIGGVHSACDHVICQSCSDTRKRKAVVYDIRGLLENWWDEWDQYDEWDALNTSDDIVSCDQLRIIEYVIRIWGDESDVKGIATWIMENWDEAKKGLNQDQQEELAL